MSDEIYIAKQETLLETKTKVEAVQATVNEIVHKPSSGGGQIIFPTISSVIGLAIGSCMSVNDSHSCITVDAAYTQSGHLEIHIFTSGRNNTGSNNKHYVWDAVTRTGNYITNTPFVMTNTIVAISGVNSASIDAYKRIHLIGSDTAGNQMKHYYFNTKTREWVALTDLPFVGGKGGCACGEQYNYSSTVPSYAFGYDDLYILSGGGNTLYKWKATTDTISVVSGSTIPKSLYLAVMLRSGTNIAICGGNTTGASGNVANNSDGYVIVPSGSSCNVITVANPLGTVAVTSSCGCIFRSANTSTSSNQIYKFYNESFTAVNLGMPQNINRSAYYYYINNGCTFSLFDSSVKTYHYRYPAYLPKGTKIFSLPFLREFNLYSTAITRTPYFPLLRVEGDAFVVDESGIAYYTIGLIDVNLNSDTAMTCGFHIEIGSGE